MTSKEKIGNKMLISRTRKTKEFHRVRKEPSF